MADIPTDLDELLTFGYVVNDSTEPWTGTLLFGWFDMDGANVGHLPRGTVTVPANSVAELGRFGVGKDEPDHTRRGDFGALFDGDGRLIAQHRLLRRRFGELPLVRDAQIDMRLENGRLTLKSDSFCWGVCLDVDGELPLPDNCFDLFPGVPYTLPWDATALGEPRIVRLGNRDAV
jgi:beta-mannosidase